MTTELPVAVVTGATGGMGRAIVRDLARTHRVIAIARDARRLADVVADNPGSEGWVADLADTADLERQIGALERIDVLANIAAIARPIPVADATKEEWDAHFQTNVTAPTLITRAALPQLRRSSGTVVFIGSGAGTRPAPGSAIYTASKHALRGLADVLRIDEEPHRVRVVTVAPGQTDTAMLRAMTPAESYEPDRYIRPESVAAAVRFAVDAPEDAHITDLAVRPRQEIARI